MFTSNSAEVFAGPTERYKVPPRPRRRKHQYHSVTALPVIGSKVKPVIDYGGSRQHWATLALHLLNAGFLKSSDKGDVVSLTRYDVDYIVTEYGIAELRHQSRRQRALNLIRIAHPDSRELLESRAKQASLI
ncbi:MAG: hypothetical protein CVU24_17340 [Betaproteobacteria bacterium HGW-Betaproteobacteria-18]|nr:MAG: hypothetical protein CVU24_17340 [Betaproteobacteria bacterium HGW-Betaproteobacteria-18]